jgi:cell division protein FtsB
MQAGWRCSQRLLTEALAAMAAVVFALAISGRAAAAAVLLLLVQMLSQEPLV